MTPPQSPLSDDELTSAIELLHRLIPKEDFPAYSLDISPATVYTTLVTLWMLTLQRLGGGKSMRRRAEVIEKTDQSVCYKPLRIYCERRIGFNPRPREGAIPQL